MISRDLYTQLIDTVSPDKVEVYLECSGWIKYKEVEGVLSLWSNSKLDKKFTILLPLDKEFADFEIKIEELVLILSRFEERSKIDILKSLGNTSVIAQNNDREIIDIKIEFKEVDKHDIPAKNISNILKSMQDFFDSLAVSEKLEGATKAHSQINIDKSKLQLSLIETFQGSFGIRVGMTEHHKLDLNENQLTEEAVSVFMKLIKASQDSSNKLQNEIKRYTGAPSIKFKQLIKNFVELESDIVVEWGSVNPQKGEITKLAFDNLVQAFNVINQSAQIQVTFEVVGRLLVAGVGKNKEKRIFVLDDETSGKEYRGHISPHLIKNLNKTLELNKLYKATIEEEITINSLTGEEIVKHTLTSLSSES